MSDASEKVTVTVRAVKAGFYNGRRRLGAEFEFITSLDSKGKPKLGSWLVLKEDFKPAPAKKEKKAPETLSEGAAETGADLA